jgi:hypothetical protein
MAESFLSAQKRFYFRLAQPTIFNLVNRLL